MSRGKLDSFCFPLCVSTRPELTYFARKIKTLQIVSILHAFHIFMKVSSFGLFS